MRQSKNDSELFLCDKCNDRLYKSDLKVEQTIVPKRESKTISYQDDFIASAFNPGQSDLFAESEQSPQSFNLLNRDDGFNPYDELEIKETMDKLKIKEQFQNLLKDKQRIKINFK